jgi:mRNA-degrading endonuclease RelE of RelBE toxin-antitoxin system
MRKFEIYPELNKKLIKLSRKDKSLHDQVIKKIEEVITVSDIDHYTNLRYDFKDSKRVHVGHFVLVFSYDESEDLIIFENLNHHDKIYER